MVMITIERVSRERIKSSSPTPHHLSHHKLSFLDQVSPPVYVHLVLFYPASAQEPNSTIQRSSLLKNSLAKCLTDFYPLAGSILRDQNSFIDCDDEGAEFVEAQVNCKLSQVISNPDMKLLNQLLPLQPDGMRSDVTERKVLLSVQVNMFECGGIGMGVCVSHKIADGTSVIAFVNAWAGFSRGEMISCRPSFDGVDHFPPRDTLGYPHDVGMTKDNIMTKRFMFDKSSIAVLKEQASSAFGSDVKGPSRVEAISALIWRCFIRSKSGHQGKILAAAHAVNLRERMVPPLSNISAFGNYWRVAFAMLKSDGSKNDYDYHILVGKLRNAITHINDDYVKKLKEGDVHTNSINKMARQFSTGEMVFCNFTSWCRFPMYEIDFGWGKPSWVCSPSWPYKNTVILMGSKDGDGVEAWVNMLEEDMVVFERDSELLSFVSSSIDA